MRQQILLLVSLHKYFLEEGKKKTKGDSLGFNLPQNLGVLCSSTCKFGVTDGSVVTS